MSTSVESEEVITVKGLAIEFRANNFYRGAVDKNGNRIIDMVGLLLGYTPQDMDYLFLNKQLPEKNKQVDASALNKLTLYNTCFIMYLCQ